MRAVDVLPLVPVMWMAGYWSCGEPEQLDQRLHPGEGGRSHPARRAPRGHAGERVEQVGVRIEPRPCFAELHRDSLRRVGIGELDLDPELVSRLDVDVGR